MVVRSILVILWARRAIIVAAMLSALAGGLLVIETSPPRYEASARVILGFLKPDPLTGATVPNKMASAYIASQIQFIRDYQVVIPAVEALGMLDNPDMLIAYSAILGDKPEFPNWVAQRIMGTINAVPIEESAIVEIRYRASTPQAALAVVDAVRQSYVDASIAQRSTSSQASADALTAQADGVRRQLALVQQEQTAIERQSGVSLQKGRRDMDSLILRQLSGRVKRGRNDMVLEAGTPSSPALNSVRAEIAEARQTLGANHPRLKELQALEARYKTQVEQENDYAARVAQAVAGKLRLENQMMEQQRDKVLSQREIVTTLRLLQDEINSQTERLNSLTKAAADLRQLSTSRETALTPMGQPVAKPNPVFPNRSLILAGTGILGLAVGSLLALLVELLSRRVRGPSDLQNAAGAPVLGQVPLIDPDRRAGMRFDGQVSRLFPTRRPAA